MITETTFFPADVEISDDKSRLDIASIHRYLRSSYWAKNIPLSIVQTSIEHSLCYGVYRQGAQIGFARVITDQATFAYLADVYVLPEHAGQGIGKKLIEYIVQDPRIANVRRFLLATHDAHGLYRQYGFEGLTELDAAKFMQVRPCRGYA